MKFCYCGGIGHIGVHLTPQNSVKLCIHHTADISPHMTLDPDSTGNGVGRPLGNLDPEAGPLDDGVPQNQSGRQHKQHQNQGNQGASTQAATHNADNRIGGNTANQERGGDHNATGGQNRGERLIDGLDNGLFMGHMVFQLLVVIGDDDGIVDIGAHLDGLHHQIAQEEQRRIQHRRHRKIEPDTALDGHNQQQRQTHRLEGQQQHHDHEENGEQGNRQIIR